MWYEQVWFMTQYIYSIKKGVKTVSKKQLLPGTTGILIKQRTNVNLDIILLMLGVRK